jgi:UDP-N-acetylmuramoyl-tripeptide--D-alanyl-D-alanine ligase
MRPRRLSDVARAVGGSMRGSDAQVTSVVTDSRAATAGSLFFALRGERADGHEFVAEALDRGAVGGVVQRPVSPDPVIEVGDTGRALLALAADERARIADATVIGVTGSNGKTSTKDFAASILSATFRTSASPGSFNNEIGLPMTLLGAPPEVEVILAEMGARHVGDHALLCEIARPDAVVITNVGVAHMEVFGSWDAVLQASAEPIEALSDVGTAILNVDDPAVRKLAGRTGAKVLTFGTASDAAVRADEVALDAVGRATFELVMGDESERVELAVPGEHMVSNALAAAACGGALGLTAAECAAGLKGVQVSRWRMETFTTPHGVVIVNDAYNANPESMAAALRAARWMAREGRLVAVLGSMAELGPISLQEHERLGELVVRLGVDRLVTVGDEARAVARAGVREGALLDSVSSFHDVRGVADFIRTWVRAGDVVLIKGSRVIGLERIAEALR